MQAAVGLDQGPLQEGDVPSILQLLLSALSQDSGVQKHAEATLASLETRQGYCSCLAAIVGLADADHSARWLASVQLKNSVAKCWRVRSDQRGVSPEEKAYLRQRVLQLIPQEDNQIAVQVALVFAKMARFDHPREWPTLFSDLLGQVPGGSTLMIRRTYFIMHHVLKELSSKRLAADQKNFAEITRQLFDHIWSQWSSDLQTIMAGLPAGLAQPMQAQSLLLHYERWLILLKVLRRLLLFGFTSDARSLEPVPAVSLCAPAMLQAVQAMQALRPAKAPKSQLLAMMDRGVLKLVKTLAQIQETHPWSYHYAGLLLPTLEFATAQLLAAAAATGDTPSSGGVAREFFLIQCMLFVVGVEGCDAYRGRMAALLAGAQGAAQADTAKQLSAAVQATLGPFWSPERLNALTTALLQHFFVLSARELERWSEDPETFCHGQDGMAWQDSLRPCAEHLYLTMLKAHRDVIAPFVVQSLHAASSAAPLSTPPDSLPGPRVAGIPSALLLKEAAYAAAAVGAYDLHDYVDFTSWLHSTLLLELNAPGDAWQPLRRAVARLLGAWVARVKAPDRPPLYAGLVRLLGEQEDACVQLSAVAALRALIDDFGFEEKEFVGHVGPCVRALAGMLRASEELDTQTQVFSLLNLIIERLGEDIRPFVEAILPLLPEVWQEAEGQSLLRIQVLSALQQLVNVLGKDSPATYPLLLPLLQHSLDAAHNREPELLEDGLQLWLVALRNAPEPHGPLLQLFPFLMEVMANSTEFIGLGTSIITSCILLGQAPFLAQYGTALLNILVSFLGNVRDKGMLMLFPPMDLLLLCYPQEGPALLQPALQKLLMLLLAGSETNTVAANALGLYARLLLQNRPAFQQLLTSCIAAGAQPPSSYRARAPAAAPGDALLGAFIELWCEHFDAVSVSVARKLSALGLCALLPLPSPAVLPQLDIIINHVTGVWHEVERSGEDNAEGIIYCSPLYYTGRADEDGMGGESLQLSEEAGGEAQRRIVVAQAEPLRQLKISTYLLERLHECASVHGQAFQDAMARMDPTIRAQLQAVIGDSGNGQQQHQQQQAQQH